MRHPLPAHLCAGACDGRRSVLASMARLAVCLAVFVAAACSDPPGPLADAANSPADAVSPADAAPLADAPPADAPPADALFADADTSLPLAGFGMISGSCGVIDPADIDGPQPRLIHNAIDFAARPYGDGDLAQLSAGGQEIYLDGNAGGSSLYSEMFAYEVLYRCELAGLLKTETEIIYDTPGPITDFLTLIDGRKIGVSVTRAYAYPPENPYTVEQARALLDRKLADVVASTANVSAKDRWAKQILHVMAYQPMHAEAIAAAWQLVDAAVRADTIVVVTVTDGDDAFLY